MESSTSATNGSGEAAVDWLAWHADYDDPNSRLSRRLDSVKKRIASALDAAPPGALRMASICAGQGRDVIDVVATHPRGPEVSALLVESDERNVIEARRRAVAMGLDEQVTAVVGDASWTDAYREAVPVDVLVCCGVFGNISQADIEATIATFPRLCAPGATVVWTRHRRHPDLTPSIRQYFAQSGFEEVAFDAPDDFFFAVGSAHLLRPPDPFESGRRLFVFVGDGSLPA